MTIQSFQTFCHLIKWSVNYWDPYREPIPCSTLLWYCWFFILFYALICSNVHRLQEMMECSCFKISIRFILLHVSVVYSLPRVCYWDKLNKAVFSLCSPKRGTKQHLLLRALPRPRTAAAPAVQQSIDISYPPGPQQQTRRTLLQRANGTDRADGRTLYSYIDPAPHTMRAVPIIRIYTNAQKWFQQTNWKTAHKVRRKTVYKKNSDTLTICVVEFFQRHKSTAEQQTH